MRAFYLISLAIIVGVVTIFIFPTMRTMLGLLDTTGWFPLMKAWLTFLPWFLLILAGWFLVNKATGR